MIKALRVLASVLVISIFSFLVSLFVCSPDFLSSILGFNVQRMVIVREHGTYQFSLLDSLPLILFVGLVFIVALVYMAYRPHVFINNLRKGYYFLRDYASITLRMIRGSKVKYFLLTSFVATVYFAYCYPVTLDEPQSYFYFMKPATWEALALYPFPNNHILSSVISGIISEIPWIDLLFKIRIPVLFVSLFTWIFAYRFVRKYYTENLALFVVAIGTVVATNLQHAYIARGYAYVMLFVVIGLYAAYNIVYNGNRHRDWLAFAISSVLGAYTMPSYLYPFLSISIFIFIYNYKGIKTQILYSVFVGVLVFVLYTPLLAVTGLEGLTSNEYVATIDRMVVLRSLPGFLLGTIVHIFYMPHYFLLALFGAVVLFTLYKRDKRTLAVWGVFIITPCLFLVLHSVIPFFRTFFYYGFLFIFMIGISFKDEIKRVKQKLLFGILMFVHLILLGYFVYISRDLMKDVFISYDLREEILEDNKTYYFSSGFSYLEMVNMEFEIERNHYNSTITGGDIYDVSLLPSYDFYVIEKEGDRTRNYAPYKTINSVFSVPVNIYKREELDK